MQYLYDKNGNNKYLKTDYSDKLKSNATFVAPKVDCDYAYFNEDLQIWELIYPEGFLEEKALISETEKYIKRTNDGINAYAKISAEFRLAKLNGQISEEQHHGIESILIPVRNEILAGQWKSGLIILENIGSSIIGIQLYQRLHTQITNYINENY